MSRVLLLNADGHHAKQVDWALRGIGCQTVTCADIESAISQLQRQPFDAVVVVSIPGMDWDIRVEFVRHAALRMSEPPQVVCLLRGPYRGPNEGVYAARKGFKVVYEQLPPFAQLIQELDVALTERRHLRQRGVHLIVTHIDHVPGTVCALGEMIEDIAFGGFGEPISLGLSHVSLLLMDCFCRYRMPLTAFRIEEIMNSDPFYVHYAANRIGRNQIIARPDRNSVRVYVPRIHKQMGRVFQTHGVDLDPSHILASESTDSNIPAYRLKATVEIVHVNIGRAGHRP